MVVLGRGAVSYERGTPVHASQCFEWLRLATKVGIPAPVVFLYTQFVVQMSRWCGGGLLGFGMLLVKRWIPF